MMQLILMLKSTSQCSVFRAVSQVLGCEATRSGEAMFWMECVRVEACSVVDVVLLVFCMHVHANVCSRTCFARVPSLVIRSHAA